MAYKYFSEIYIDEVTEVYAENRVWRSAWYCREFAQRDIKAISKQGKYSKYPLTIRVGGLNMRTRYPDEQEGMARFASLLLPDNPINVDSTSIWIKLLRDEDNYLIHLPKEVWSLMLFYIKYLSIQMKDRVDFERTCKALIKRKHQVFRNIPDQQLGTALYFFSYVKYPKQMEKYSNILKHGNGPGTAMRQLAHLEDKTIDVPTDAGEFYYAMLEEWCSTFKKELQYMVNYHSKDYARFWYFPLLIQDVYTRIYDGDGRFDNIEYGDDEW